MRPLLYIPMTLIYGLLILLGWLVVPIAVLFEAYHIVGVTNHGGDKFAFTVNWINTLFMNYEDGICEGWQYRKKRHSVPNQIIYWTCLRNPASCIRWMPILSVKIKPGDIKFYGSFLNYNHPAAFVTPELFKLKIFQYDNLKVPQWFYAWQGWYSTFYWQFIMPLTVRLPFTKIGYFKGDLMRAWAGWAIYPTDIYGVTEYRKDGAGFKLQFKRVKV